MKIIQRVTANKRYSNTNFVPESIVDDISLKNRPNSVDGVVKRRMYIAKINEKTCEISFPIDESQSKPKLAIKRFR